MVTDLELIKEVLDGRKEYYAELVRRYQGKVIHLCTSLLPAHISPEDAAQEVFIKVYKSLLSFKGNASFSTWLYRIAANHCKDLQRKNNREHAESLDSLFESEGEKLNKFFRDPSDVAQNLENSELINRILSCLPIQYREVLVLREAQGLSYSEIAEVLECSVDSVKARLQRAREDLLKCARHFFKLENV